LSCQSHTVPGELFKLRSRRRGTKGNRLFYMATPPSAFRPIACQLGRSRLACEENGSLAPTSGAKADLLCVPPGARRVLLVLERGVGSRVSASFRRQIESAPDRPDRVEGAGVSAGRERQLAGPPVVESVLVAREHVQDGELLALGCFRVIVAVEGVVPRTAGECCASRVLVRRCRADRGLSSRSRRG
jgi:hypothetical protein